MKTLSRWVGADESGSIAVVASLSLVLVLGMAAIVVDLGHLYVVHGEMQTASEAGANAGARALAMGPAGTPLPNWDNGINVATSTVQRNYVDGVKLSDFNTDSNLQKVQSGYWDLRWNADTAPTSLNGYLNPSGYAPDPNFEVPAVKVTIAKAHGGNGGSAPVSSYFASLWGINSSDLQTTAVMVIYPSGSGPAGDVFPLVAPKSFADQYWGTTDTFKIYSEYHAPPDMGGQWTSFLVNNNSASYEKSLVDNGNPSPIKLNDQVYLQPGTEASVYKEVANRVGQTMLLAVVEDVTPKTWQSVVAFIPFKITGYSQGQKYVQGHFVQDYTVPGSPQPGTLYYGAHSAPRQVY